MTWMDDDELESQFRTLRREDEASAPDFRLVLRPVRASAFATRRGVMSTTFWIVVAASVLLAAGVALPHADSDDRILLVSSSVPLDLVAWESPTALLLPDHASALGSPEWLFTSVLDGATRGLGQLDGADR